MSTPVYELCDAYIAQLAELDPIMATSRGLLGHEAELTDYSPDGIAARTEHDRATLARLSQTPLQGWRDRIAGGLLREWCSSRLALDEAGETLRAVRVISSPFQAIRQVFDLMARGSDEDWVSIAMRLELVPDRLAGLRRSLTEAVQRGLPPARRQSLACAAQGATWAGSGSRPSFFAGLAGGYGGRDELLRRRLEGAAVAAADAYDSTGRWLRAELAPAASERDAVGPDRYVMAARWHLGTTIDAERTYAAGWAELHRIEAEMAVVAAQIVPGASVGEVIEILETDPARALHGEDALRDFLQRLMDRTIAELDGVHFDIAPPLRRVEAMIAPPGGTAAMYYTGPSEDFERPGRTWYPTLGKTVFPIWTEISTCYHEGVPGHHLQIGRVRYLKDQLSRFQRAVWAAGHGEGWALYAERLMDELGAFENPEHRLGFLRSQVLRACRVVVDIGVHLELAIPADEPFHPGERWTPDLARGFLLERARSEPDFVLSELDRYLGWPGQAIAYKVGERAWLDARDQVRRHQGAAFDLKSFHDRALDLGPLSLDQLATEVAAWNQSPEGGTPGAAAISSEK